MAGLLDTTSRSVRSLHGVVWAAANRPQPTMLLSLLRSRMSRVELVADAPAVMAALARGGRVLIVCEPHKQPRLTPLLTAVGRYHRQVACWQYDPLTADGRPRLSALAIPAEKVAPQANLIAAANEETQQSPPAAEDDLDLATPLISTEELDMLLGGPVDTEPASADADDQHVSQPEL